MWNTGIQSKLPLWSQLYRPNNKNDMLDWKILKNQQLPNTQYLINTRLIRKLLHYYTVPTKNNLRSYGNIKAQG
jgi:hypothetical protein